MSVETVRILHFSDLLLDDPGHDIAVDVRLVGKLKEERLNILEKIAELAKKEKIDCIVSNGNFIYDECIRSDTIGRTKEILAECKCPVYFTAGKKDPLHNLSYYKISDFPPNCHIFSSEKLEVIDLFPDVHLYGMSISEGESRITLNKEEIKKEELNLLILQDGMRIDDDSDFDCVLVPSSEKKNSRKKVSHSLPLLPLRPGGISGITLLECGKDSLSSKRIKVSDIEIKEVEVVLKETYNMDDLEKEISSVIGKKSKRTILKLKIRGAISPDLSPDWQEVKKELTQQFYSVSLEVDVVPHYDLRDILKSDDLCGKYIREVTKKDDLEVIASSKGEMRDALYMGLNLLMGRPIR